MRTVIVATNEKLVSLENVIKEGGCRRVVYDRNGRGFEIGKIRFYDSVKGEEVLETVDSYFSEVGKRYGGDLRSIQFDCAVVLPKTLNLTKKGIFLKKTTSHILGTRYDVYIDLQLIGDYKITTIEEDRGTSISYQDILEFNDGTVSARGYCYSKDKGIESHKTHWKKQLSDMLAVIDTFEDVEELQKWVDRKKLNQVYLHDNDYKRIGRN